MSLYRSLLAVRLPKTSSVPDRLRSSGMIVFMEDPSEAILFADVEMCGLVGWEPRILRLNGTSLWVA